MTSNATPRRHRYRDVGKPDFNMVPLVNMSTLVAHMQAHQLGLSIATKPTPVPAPMPAPVYSGFMPHCYPTLIPAPVPLTPLYDHHGRFVGYMMP